MTSATPTPPTLRPAGLSPLAAGLALAGLALATVLIGRVGAGRVAHAIAAIGWHGFAVVCAWQMLLFGALGLCWFVLAPLSSAWRLATLIWGRMVRDAAAQCLPFSLIGGFVFGARAITLRGVPWAEAAASTVVDISTEFVAQIGLVLIGAAILAVRSPHAGLLAPVLAPVLAGVVLAAAAGSAVFWLQRGAGAPLMSISRRLLGSWSSRAAPHMAAIQTSLDQIYARPIRVALCTALHLVCWFGTGVASYLAFNLLGAHLDFPAALAIEAMLHAALALAVLVPGHAGVQEAAYVAVAALFGQPAEIALGVSLLRRARDISLGLPVLALWQALEWRHRQLDRAPLRQAAD